MNTKIHFVLDLGHTHKDTTKNFLDLKPVSVHEFMVLGFFNGRQFVVSGVSMNRMALHDGA